MATESITAKRPAWTIPKPNWLQGLLVLGLAACALGLLVYGWMQTRSTLVIEVDGARYEVRTHASTVDEALRRAGIPLHPEDKTSPGRAAPLLPGALIQVQRARPVALSADGHIYQIRTHAVTVGALLREAGVQLGPGDEIWLDSQQARPDTPLYDQVPTPRTVSSRGGPRPVERQASEPPLVVLHRAASIVLDDGGMTSILHTTLPTVGQVLDEHGVTLFLGDAVAPGLQDAITSGMTIAIERSVPVQIAVDGREVRTRTRGETVADALGQEGVALVGRDRVEPALDTSIRPNMDIRIVRVHEELVIEFDPIPFDTVWVPDPDVEIDQIRQVQAGQIGLNKRRYRVVYEEGQEVDRSLEDSWAEQPPITKTMAYGTKIVVRTLETPDGPIEYWRKIRVYTTSYKPASSGKPKDHPRYGYTRLGWKLRRGIVAVDPTVIPLRTEMYVPGYGLAKAGDTGGGVKGKFVDLGFSDNDYESWHWWTDIYLLTPVPSPNKIRWILPDHPNFPDRRR